MGLIPGLGSSACHEWGQKKKKKKKKDEEEEKEHHHWATILIEVDSEITTGTSKQRMRFDRATGHVHGFKAPPHKMLPD